MSRSADLEVVEKAAGEILGDSPTGCEPPAHRERVRPPVRPDSQIIWVADADGQLNDDVPDWRKVTGQGAEEIKGLGWLDALHPEDFGRAVAEWLRSVKTGRAFESQFRVLAVGGGARRFAVRAVPVPDDKGGIREWVGVCTDVTEAERIRRRLEHSEERYRRLLDNANDIIYTHDLSGNFTSLNRAGERITGYSRREALRMNIANVIVPEHLDLAKRMITSKTSDESGTVYELDIRARDGRRVPLEVSTRLVCENGKPVGVLGIARDITERRCAELAVQESQARYRELVENATDIIFTHDLQGNYQSINKAGELITGYTVEEARLKKVDEIVAPEYREQVRRMVAEKLAGVDKTSYEIEIVAKDGRRVALEINTRLIYHGGAPVGVQGIARDVTERKRAEAQLLHNAFHDALTGLPNRAAFMERLELAVRRARRRPHGTFAVIFLDVDRFKIVNDSLGHTVGDQLLVEIGRRLEGTLRCPPDIVARHGGDEFTVLLEDVSDIQDAVRAFERVQKRLGEPFALGGAAVYVTASAGIVLGGPDDKRPEDLLREADSAMHRAKTMGKARYQIFDRTMHEHAVALMRTEFELRGALKRREFAVYYQPLVTLAAGEVAGFEALVRWRHPERGLLRPDQFISVAEESGLIVEMDRWVMNTACRQVSAWQRRRLRGRPLKLSVNLSARQFSHPDLIDHVREALSRSGLDASDLQLEITESFLMSDLESITRVIGQLKELGVGLHLDDFGTGYSSLGYLHRFHPNALKIDRAFISHVGGSDHDLEIVRAIVTLAHNLRMDVIAEGVETEIQRGRLQGLGCEFGQGFLFSKPVTAARAAALLRAAD